MSTPADIQKLLHKLHDLCVDAGLHEKERRHLLLAQIPPSIVSGLKDLSIPRDQLLSDILTLHEMDVHFRTWLGNAEYLVPNGAHKERLEAWRVERFAPRMPDPEPGGIHGQASQSSAAQKNQVGLGFAEDDLAALLVDAMAIHELRRLEHRMPTETIEECRALIQAMGFIINYHGWRPRSVALSILDGLTLRARRPGQALIVHEACGAVPNFLGWFPPTEGGGTHLWYQAAQIGGAVVYSTIRYRDDLALVNAGGEVLEMLLIAASQRPVGPTITAAIEAGIKLAETPTHFKNGPNAELAAVWLRFLLERGRTHMTGEWGHPPVPEEAAEMVRRHQKAAGISPTL